MEQHNIIVPKTARYFMLGEAESTIDTVWFVCHGYAQLANYFIKNFESLDTSRNLIIAPEGLHRFYWGKFSGRVVASWMTKEDRASDIQDYVNYLDLVYEEVLAKFGNRKKIKINVLGFSQGTATVCRWLTNGKSKADNLIIWAGAFPDDMDYGFSKAIFDKLKTHVVVGDSDEFISEEELKKHLAVLDAHEINYQLTRFSGGHEIQLEAFKKVCERL